MRKLFGTDGIRGRANRYPMTSEVALKVGRALGILLKAKAKSHPTVLIGKDTRLSGYMIEQALASGLNSVGVNVQLVGPLPTPGIGFLATNMRVDAGVVISASHNPYFDNGIKIFGSDGFKLSDEEESRIESMVSEMDFSEEAWAEADHVGRTRRIDDSAGRYIVNVKNTFPNQFSLEGLRIVLDTAHGAAYKVAPLIFEELGAEVIRLGDAPNGRNINDQVGALYPNKTREALLKYRADIGICLDGDADRVVLIDEKGDVVNGDHILGICALHLKSVGKLSQSTLVVTHMSNLGLEQKMKENGIRVVKTPVGDKHVVEEMRRSGFVLGGEQSGHIIFLNHSTTGDGCVAALNVLATMIEQKKTLSALSSEIPDFPQTLLNVRTSQRWGSVDEISGAKEAIEAAEKRLGSEGRIFIRFSGTEPLLRILAEGPHEDVVEEVAEELRGFFVSRLGPGAGA